MEPIPITEKDRTILLNVIYKTLEKGINQEM